MVDLPGIRELRQVGGTGFYKLKEVVVHNAAVLTAVWLLRTLEELHEPGWEVCAVTSIGTPPAGIWIAYRRVLMQ